MRMRCLVFSGLHFYKEHQYYARKIYHIGIGPAFWDI